MSKPPVGSLAARAPRTPSSHARNNSTIPRFEDAPEGPTQGKDTDRLRRLGLDRLSTHGLLKTQSKSWILSLLRRLITAGLVDLTPNEFPVPLLTKKGIATMKGALPVRVLLPASISKVPHREKHRSKDAESPGTVDSEAFEKLRAARLEITKEKGVPAYIICHDRTLREIASHKPSTLDELSRVHGMGPARIESYGDRFLSALLACNTD